MYSWNSKNGKYETGNDASNKNTLGTDKWTAESVNITSKDAYNGEDDILEDIISDPVLTSISQGILGTLSNYVFAGSISDLALNTALAINDKHAQVDSVSAIEYKIAIAQLYFDSNNPDLICSPYNKSESYYNQSAIWSSGTIKEFFNRPTKRG
jgi:hypothetical protein